MQSVRVTEELLAGGVANAGAVTRVGDEVRRPSSRHSRSIHRFLSALSAAGFDGAPRPLGFDGDGRERLVFIPGDVAVPPYPSWVQTDEALASISILMRRFHEASGRVTREPDATWSSDLADPLDGSIVCHNDVCLENVVFRDGSAVALLDFDFAAPGRVAYDLAQCARMCVPLDDDLSATQLGWNAANRPARFRTFTDAYGLGHDARMELVDLISDSMARGGEFVRRRVDAGDPNYIALWDQIGGMERFDRRRQWWADERERFIKAVA